MTPLAAYALLFVAVGIGFIFVHLLAGKMIRPSNPETEKGTIYECGEPTIGSAWVQFDLRFYVVALLFVIFDVEVAFFFPWAEVFGKASQVAALPRPAVVVLGGPDARQNLVNELTRLAKAGALPAAGERALALLPPYESRSYAQARAHYQSWSGLQTRTDVEKLSDDRLADTLREYREVVEGGSALTWMAFGEIAVFFGVLLVGFAYLWRRGDLVWVRSLSERQAVRTPPPSAPRPVAHELVGTPRT